MMLATIDRPLTGWADRYVKAHIKIMTKDEAYQWFLAIDAYGKSLKQYVSAAFFKDASIKRQQELLDEFSKPWMLPYGAGLLQLLHHYQHLDEVVIFVDTWKAFYYRVNGYFCVAITTPSLLKEKEVALILEALSVARDKCILSQRISPQLLGGLVVECNGIRYDTSVSGQLRAIKRNLNDLTYSCHAVAQCF